ncbi:PAS domain S-box protein [Oculatella sp. FACHB-28]|uniref:sensor histidine kinase n=1 Tax=Oculatella sp. FACHB-28 TaxID=2692845 RepID=UPI001687DE4D|nr:PAS domain S-box protein [Oculatella sp. FACHB-28]MBD2059576.1 PAS domain S-box protein [Oculatella sp. FACHB-28]
MSSPQSSVPEGQSETEQIAMLQAQKEALEKQLHQAKLELQQSNERLHQQEQDLEAALEGKERWITNCLAAADMAAWELDIPTGENKWSEKVEELYGFAPGTYDSTLESFFDRVHPDDRETIKRKDEEAFQTGTFEVEFRIIHPDGTIRWIAAKAKVFYDKLGKPVRMSGVDRDITEQKQTEANLQRVHQQLAFHVENSPLAVVEWNENLQVQHWSARAEEIFGWQASEVLHRYFQEWKFDYEQDLQQVEAVITALISGSQSRNICCNRNYTKSGEVVHCEWYNSALLDEDGKLISILSLVLDVTEQKQLEKARQRSLSLLETTLESTADGILVLDPVGKIMHINCQFIEQWGVPEAVIAAQDGKALVQFQQKQLKKPDALTLGAEAGHSDKEGYELLEFKDGRVLECYSKPQLLNGEVVGQVISYRDITVYKQAEATLRQQAQRERALNELKDDFLSTVSHELRTPITNIKMATQMLDVVLGRLHLEDERVAQYLKILQEQCTQEMNLLNTLLDLQSLEARTQALQLTAIGLQDWVPDVAKSFETRIQSQKQSLSVNIPADLPNLISDESSLKRILAELLNNACKYTPPGEKIVVIAEVCDSTLQLRVCNSGVEIPEVDLPRIFNKFYRVTTIQVESAANLTSFIIRLPIASNDVG